MLQPELPNYDIAQWRSLSFSERLRLTCQSWALQWYGTPFLIFVAYGFKILAYIGGWWVCCGFSEGVDFWNPMTSWAHPQVFLKAILWTMLFEGLGLGCGSGPLTARYAPPVGGFLYFLRPGTLKLPWMKGWPLIGGDQRTILDVGLYALQLVLLGYALTSSVVHPGWVMAIVAMTFLLGALDKTLFLAFRSEHYLSVLICVLFAEDWIAGSKWVWLAIWWWAATSKLNLHFPVVMCVMVSNSPWTRFVPGLRRAMYRDVDGDDLRPSRFAGLLAHSGTVMEYAFPLLLIWGGPGWLLWGGLAWMTLFHLFILSHVPMGVPLEWNVIMIYGAFVLFGVHSDVSMLEFTYVGLIVWLVSVHLVLPAYGSWRPERVSFLLAMRYYAGNWAYGVWLFRPGVEARLDERLTKSSSLVPKQLSLMYDEDTITALMSKVVAFRMMHLHGRALLQVLPQAVEDVDNVVWYDGEVIAGLALGWNFGDGHLHGPQLQDAIQARCEFAPGDVRVIMVESQAWGSRGLKWEIRDLATGTVATGEAPVRPMLEVQPWHLRAD